MEFEFDKEGVELLKVNYSEKLVTLVKDSRAIGELGYRVDNRILGVTDKARKFYKEGVALK